MADHDLQRFVDAQLDTYATALAELRAGQKREHWIWWVLPQLRGLGHSATSELFGIGSRAEAEAYWAHPVLGPRLAECVDALLALDPRRTAEQVLGPVDAVKLRSCLTLFAEVVPGEPRFHRALDRYCGGNPDSRTLDLLARL